MRADPRPVTAAAPLARFTVREVRRRLEPTTLDPFIADLEPGHRDERRCGGDARGICITAAATRVGR